MGTLYYGDNLEILRRYVAVESMNPRLSRPDLPLQARILGV